MARIWVPCTGPCKGSGGWYVEAERGRQVWVVCGTCGGARGKYVIV